jgi:PAS domain S-box-containing protein
MTRSTQRESAVVPASRESPANDVQELLESGEVGLHWLSTDGTILWANRTDYERLGYAADEYIGHQIQEFHADERVRDELLHRVETGEPVQSLHAPLRARDGSIRHILLSAHCRFDEAGRLLHTRFVTRDVTDQQRAALELRESREALEALAEFSRTLAGSELDRPSALDEIAAELAEIFGDGCAIRTLSPDGQWLELRGFHHRDPTIRELIARSRPRTPAWQGASGRVMRASPASRFSPLDGAILREVYGSDESGGLEHQAAGGMLMVRLESRRTLRGTIAVWRALGEGYSDADERLLRELAAMLGVNILASEQQLELSRERERYEAATVHAERGREQLQRLVDALPAMVAFVQRDLHFTFANSAVAEWLGVSRPELATKTVEELLGPDFFELARQHVERALLGEQVSLLGEMKGSAGVRAVRATFIPQPGHGGDVEGFILLANDIGDEQRHETTDDLLQAEQKARERLVVLAQASEVLSRSLDYERTLQSVTALVVPLLGDFGFFDLREGDEVRRIARSHDDARAEELLRSLRFKPSGREELDRPIFASGHSTLQTNIDESWMKSMTSDAEHLASLRELGVRSMITVPLTYQGNSLGSLTLFFGPSGRKHTEADLTLAEEIARRAAAAIVNARLFKEARDAIGVRDDFLSMAGHELRTPLTALQLQILSITKMVGLADGAEKIASRAEKASRNVLRLSNLVNELLDISRITAGRLKLERSPLALADAVQDVIHRHADELEKNGCEVLFSCDGSAHGIWDPMRVEQIATNLLTNAIKYGKGKPIEVKIERAQGIARLIVRDHGIGIPPEDQQRIFQRFERAVSSRHFGGLGFGLWIARQLVDAHGGNIKVTSELGSGATFEVELPLQPPDEVQA